MMFDAVTHDMPSLRTPLKRLFGIMTGWSRIPRVSQASEPIAFPGLAQ
jgi:hypothetical protein